MSSRLWNTRTAVVVVAAFTTIVVAATIAGVIRALVPAIDDAPPWRQVLIGVAVWMSALALGVCEAWYYWPRH